MGFRIEKDSLGEFKVPDDALYGVNTARAVDNFPISSRRFNRQMIRALGWIKSAAAKVNAELGLIKSETAGVIQKAAAEVIDGKLDSAFPIDIFQTGSGTSSNMNANEVIANRASQLLGGKIGDKHLVHPNDQVNFGQSSNDCIPTMIHLGAVVGVEKELLPALVHLHAALKKKAQEFDPIVKIGRTHLQDATPIRLGQEFSGYAAQVEEGMQFIKQAVEHLRGLPQGGTAVGTGINTHPEFGKRMATALTQMTGCPFTEARNHFAAQGSMDAAARLSGALKALAAGLIKIANDIRWLGSGPRLGLGELEIPAVQPGSSIMPGKVNPVICESLIMACSQVIANDTAVTLGVLYGNFELNTMLPLIASNLLEQVTLLGNGAQMFADKLVVGLKANTARIESLNEQSLSLATVLAPHIGYDKAAEIAKESYKTGKTVREIAHERQVLPKAQLDALMDLRKQTEPGV